MARSRRSATPRKPTKRELERLDRQRQQRRAEAARLRSVAAATRRHQLYNEAIERRLFNVTARQQYYRKRQQQIREEQRVQRLTAISPEQLLAQLRRKLIRQFPAAVEIYNNPFSRLQFVDPHMLDFLKRLSSEDYAKLIRQRDGQSFNRTLRELG